MMVEQIQRAVEILAAKIATGNRPDEAIKYAAVIYSLTQVLLDLESCNGSAGVGRIIEKLSILETNLGAMIMITKDEVLATVAVETQEVLDKIAADRAEIDAAQTALATAQAQVTADQADLAAKETQIADLQAQIDALVAAGAGTSQEDLVAINDAIKLIFTPTVA